MERPVTKPEQTDFPNSPFDTLDVHHDIDWRISYVNLSFYRSAAAADWFDRLAAFFIGNQLNGK